MVVWQGMFAVHRDHVRQRSRDGYARLCAYVDHHSGPTSFFMPGAQKKPDSNPEAGHYLERAWLAVFAPIPTRCCYRLVDGA